MGQIPASKVLPPCLPGNFEKIVKYGNINSSDPASLKIRTKMNYPIETNDGLNNNKYAW